MSFLKKKIDEILNSSNLQDDVFDLVHQFKAEVEKEICQLYTTKDLRIFDGEGGGILRGHISSRKKNECETKDSYLIACDVKYITDVNEVAFSRAVFNAKAIGTFKIIAYEAPLMRKKTANTNQGIHSRLLSCDLIGLDRNIINCIEVKTKPTKNNPQYAILEGFAYCICLNWILRVDPSELSREIKLCCDAFGITGTNLPDKACFYVAGPLEDFFMPYWYSNNSFLGPSALYNCKQQTELLEKALKQEYEGYFGGYLAIPHPSKVNPNTKICKSLTIPELSDEYRKMPIVKHFRSFF